MLQSYVRKLCSASERAHVCIVGSGPAGFYTAQQLLKVCLKVSGNMEIGLLFNLILSVLKRVVPTPPVSADYP